ncbi:MAG: hypothetical protein JWM10_685 [Myxococcaceae bacterium]|nr:hypothetical protein [Myxococcaceae bacterium]
MTRAIPPSAEAVGRAIDLYLARAYDGPAPPRVAALVDAVRASPDGRVYDSAAFERDGEDRYALRLGNRAYPHMKLVVERIPRRDAWFFRADAHDQHVSIDPSDPDFPAFQALMAHNQATAAAIESAWEEAGLDTFRAFLRRDLDARRR